MDDLRARLRAGCEKVEQQHRVDDVRAAADKLRDCDEACRETGREQARLELMLLRRAIDNKKSELGKDNHDLLRHLETAIEQPADAIEELIKRHA